MNGPDIPALDARIELLEAESACRRLTAHYFRICDDLGPHTDLQALGEIFTEDAVWQGKGRYEAVFGRYQGRPAIVAMIASYCRPPHFAMTGHFFSAEDIAVSGEAALGRWMMLQCSTYADGSSDLRSAALTLEFVRGSDARWRISLFQSLNIFSRRVDHWSDAAAIPVPELHGSAT